MKRTVDQNPRTSISNQPKPGPGPGIARKTKITIAVPMTTKRDDSGSSVINFFIKNKMISIEPINTISWANGTFKIPTPSVKMTKTKLPPRIHQLGWVLTTKLCHKFF